VFKQTCDLENEHVLLVFVIIDLKTPYVLYNFFN
jgi:hypothetical protein